jgi:queuine tRNA-ribosyltransferase
MFKNLKIKENGIRLGRVKTAHGSLDTPFYMPDATRGFVKLLSNKEVKSTNTKAMVVNTFHLYLQPGIDLIKKAGGIHKFMNFSGPLLSDSGGFQVFSLIHRNSKMGKISDEKVVFKSPLNGSWHDFSPEKSIQIQFDLGVDMMVCLDDCPPNEYDRKQLEEAVNRTVSWAKRCKREYNRQIKKRKIKEDKRPLLFSVIQGGAELDLREKCAKELVKIGFDGYGFGARPVDEKGNFLTEVLDKTASYIPKDKLRFALGIGTPEDILACSKLGWDMFDCVIPSREGRHGRLFYNYRKSYKTLNINNSKFISDFTVINHGSKIDGLKNYSKSYLKHLFQLKEPLGQRLATLNNLEFFQGWLEKIREDKNLKTKK